MVSNNFNIDTKIIKLLEMAFWEDLGDLGDITSDTIFNDNKTDIYWLVAKQEGVICGVDIFACAFNYIDKECIVNFYVSDGDNLKTGQKVAKIEGSINTILKAERVALNFISHLSGIATEVRKWIDVLSLIPNNNTKILDTRKTLPGWRQLQKYAVKCGGGNNHRMGLYDMVMIKDNHIDSIGSITKAVEVIRSKWGERFKIEVETRNIREVQEALDADVDIIMLDNMDIDTMKEAVRLINKRAKSEASGNMNLERLKAVAETGVDYISVGALTHSVTVFDFSLRKDVA
ncbi:nicotinate-nucleotide pyrophosphorylase [Candidatus Magnetoovum chiemensis]|nr:nicotinate-nucleotide pyrophosphorylase [Candidatus Magnetoovum chiemensis]